MKCSGIFFLIRYTAGIIPVSMEKIHGLYDSDNADNGYGAPNEGKHTRRQMAGGGGKLPTMFYGTTGNETVNSNPIKVEGLQLRLQNQSQDFERSKNRRLKEMKESAEAENDDDIGRTKKKVGKLKVPLPKSNEERPRQQQHSAAVKAKDEKSMKDKINLLKTVMENDRKGGQTPAKKKEKANKKAIATAAASSLSKPSLLEKREGKPANVDILCGIQKESDRPSDSAAVSCNVDEELDNLLSQLEFDQSFQKLTDNEKMSWLESLFYQDTKPKVQSIMRGAGGNKKAIPTQQQRPQQQQRPTQTKQRPTAAEATTKKKILPTAAAAAANSSTNSADVNVNQNLISLAQSFFDPQPPPNAAKSSTPRSSSSTRPHPMTPTVLTEFSTAAALPAENSSFQNNNSTLQDLKIPAAESSSSTAPPPPPPIPPRSVQPKTTMLRLMNSATNILKK